MRAEAKAGCEQLVILGLGSNLGDRLSNLRQATYRLTQRGLRELVVSPVVETSAWLKPGAPEVWNRPYLNLVLQGRTSLSPHELLTVCQDIEIEMGRGPHEIWAPRIIDLDILSWSGEPVSDEALVVPHRELAKRPFVLDPWMALAPQFPIPIGGRRQTVLELRRRLPDACPLLMGIVNITPDSFSDGGEHFTSEALESYFHAVESAPPAILDLGGQSTRPGAELVGVDEEWRRLSLALEKIESLHSERVRPWVSVDTFHGELAQRAVEWGVEIINDVSGFDDPKMLELAAASKAQFVFMHHLGVPVRKGQTLPEGCDPVAEVMAWALRKLEALDRKGVGFERLIFDPGIGFGKTAQQSMELIRRAAEFKALPIRVLYGHSRKSYQRTVISQFPHLNLSDADAITIAQSLQLADAGVEFLRVHNVPAHRKALLEHFARKDLR